MAELSNDAGIEIMYEVSTDCSPELAFSSRTVLGGAAIRDPVVSITISDVIWNRNLGDRSGIPAVDDLQTPLWIHVRDATTITTEDQSGLIGARCWNRLKYQSVGGIHHIQQIVLSVTIASVWSGDRRTSSGSASISPVARGFGIWSMDRSGFQIAKGL